MHHHEFIPSRDWQDVPDWAEANTDLTKYQGSPGAMG